MLCLSRKKDQRIVIGGLDELYVKRPDGTFEPAGPVTVIVSDIQEGKGKVRLAVNAHPDVRVDRLEVLNAIRRERGLPCGIDR